MYNLIKSILFLLPPEVAHSVTMSMLRVLVKFSFFTREYRDETEFSGLKFKNKLGMAAGFDKNAKYVDILEKLGFGYVEIGTVTPLAQDGNPKPRLFRLKKDNALLNRMGFNNGGADEAVKNLKKYRNRGIIIGGNIGKNKVTSNEEAHTDYLKVFEKIYDYVDYFVVNVSSPNTPNLRELQDKGMLEKIFEVLQKSRAEKEVKKPIFLKIAPDLNPSQLDDIISVYENMNIEALIATNTTIDYTILKEDRAFVEKEGSGGVSGRQIFEKSISIVKYLKSKNPNMKIIGVGGIDSKERADQMINEGCSLVQVYTGFVYGGVGLIDDILG